MDQGQTVQNQADDQVKLDSVPLQPRVSQPKVGLGLGEKERETAELKEAVEEVGKEIEPAKEIEKLGVQLKKEEIKLPPAVEKMGVRPSGAAMPAPSAPAVTLPLTDDQVVKGLAFPLISSLRWLAEFCLRQLKKAHIGLKKVHGKMVRIEVK